MAASKLAAETYNKLFCMTYNSDGIHTFSVSNLLSMIVLRSARPNLYAFLSSSKNTRNKHVTSFVISAMTTATIAKKRREGKKKHKNVCQKKYVKTDKSLVWINIIFYDIEIM